MAATTTGAGASGTADSTATGSNIYTGFGGKATGTSKSSAPATQAIALGLGRTYGLLIVLGGVMGGFIFML